ncbi:hypothetical protein H5410_006935 [Solanum commersonii]|uniref:Uncharacterized protein n=1 Tax=Solanum commersonii TaxID=4109 RepID=A0A9J6AAP9_SOLCO|nr:hypothetical protein H5410_006935 [Solanum commersonii]
MSNFESSSKTPLSQEVENPSSFNFSIPTPEDSPSTPICGAEPQSVAKTGAKLFSEEIEVGLMAVSSTMSERLFEGDLPKGRGPDSCILTAGAELVVVQSLASLKEILNPHYWTKNSGRRIRAMVKRKREVEEERVKSKGTQKRGSKSKKKKRDDKEERIAKMEHQKMLNGRVFDTDIITKFGMANLFYVVTIQEWSHLFEPHVPYLLEPEVREFFYKIKLLENGGITTTIKDITICLDEEILGIILGVPVKGVRTIEGCKPSGNSPSLPPSEDRLSVHGYPRSSSKGNISWCL